MGATNVGVVVGVIEGVFVGKIVGISVKGDPLGAVAVGNFVGK